MKTPLLTNYSTADAVKIVLYRLNLLLLLITTVLYRPYLLPVYIETLYCTVFVKLATSAMTICTAKLQYCERCK